MKNFRTLAQAKLDLREYANYIRLIEEYEPKTLTQHAIYIYAREGNLTRTAEKLNQMKLHNDKQPLEGKDIKAMLLSKPVPDDLLHKEIRRLYKRKVAPPPKRYY